MREQIELSGVAGGVTGTALVNGQAAVGRYVGLRTSDPQGQFVGYADPSTDANGVFRAIIAAGMARARSTLETQVPFSFTVNPGQTTDIGLIGPADEDGDGVPDSNDNCP
ncbi:MAG: thrombospondin type 3 repeat-containing protein [Bryobacterales bacterium]